MSKGNGKGANGGNGHANGKRGTLVETKPGLPKLNGREAKFVADYCVFFNGARAVRNAGYETTTPQEYARALLTNTNIQAHIKARLADLGELHFKLHEENTERLISMRDADRTDIYNEDGSLRDPREWPEACKQILCGIEVETEMRGEGDAAYLVRTTKVKLSDPKAIIDSLAKITGQWIERSQQIGKDGKPVDPAQVTPVLIISYGNQLPAVKDVTDAGSTETR